MLTKDTLWKSIIEDFFQEMMMFFYPQHIHELDFANVEFLDNELQQLFPEAMNQHNYADKLVKLRWKNSHELWLLVHVEVQGYVDEAFPDRMFRYFYRIYERYGIPIEALAIFTDDRLAFHPQNHRIEALKTTLDYSFYTYKVIEQEKKNLENDTNPFSLLILTAFEAIEKKRVKDEELLELKIQLFRKLLSRGYDKKLIHRFTLFIKHYVRFKSDEFEQAFEKEIDVQLGRKESMGIIEAYQQALIEEAEKKGKDLGLELGLKQGFKKGLEQALIESIEKLLIKGFAVEKVIDLLEVPKDLVIKVQEKLRKEGKLE